MRQSRPADMGTPRPEELAAYLDGELSPARQESIATWLRHHPEAAAEIEGQRRLAGVWPTTTPAEPADANWASMLVRIESAVDRFRSARGRNRRRIQLGITGLAAGLLLVLLTPKEPGPAEAPSAGEPLAVVSPDDVEIVSLHAADRATLVVGAAPVMGPLVLASSNDVELEGVDPADDGMIPSIHMDERTIIPMSVAPLDPPPAGLPEPRP
ncbi:MAG TPA: hypothetical protein VKU02_08805 [Gemmataceae bacterium]|nr:hypothetical protein [Gemmataceae bacterium]